MTLGTFSNAYLRCMLHAHFPGIPPLFMFFVADLFFLFVGWFLLLSSIIGYWRVKRWETSVRAAAAPATPSTAQVQRDRSVRRNLEEVFGFHFEQNHATEEHDETLTRRDSSGNLVPVSQSELALTRNLRAAGII